MPPASGRRNSLTPVPPNDTSHDSADDDYFTRLERPDLPSSPAAPQHASKRSPSHTRSPRRWDHGSFDRTDPDPDPSPPWWRRSRWLPPLLLTLLLARYRSQLLLHIRSLLTKHRHKLPLLAAALPSFPALPSFLRRPPPRPQPNQTPLPLSALLSPSPSSLSLTSSYAQLPNGRVNYPSHLLPTLVKSLLSSNSPPSIAFPPPAQPNAILSNALAVLIPVGYLAFLSRLLSKHLNPAPPASFHPTLHTPSPSPPPQPALDSGYASPPPLPPSLALLSIARLPPFPATLPPPAGFVLSGAPGTGKTHYARCLLNSLHANLHPDWSFYSCQVSGSAFVEKYVGVGASRIRSLYADLRAKCAARRKNGKDCFAVVLIDEVDSLGTSRRTENSEGGSEGDSALNQLLAELDGCGSGDRSVRVVTIGTTNRLNMLDPALVRPGRMDGVYELGKPVGRRGVMEVLEKCGVEVGFSDIKVEACMGMSQAEIAGKVKEWRWRESGIGSGGIYR